MTLGETIEFPTRPDSQFDSPVVQDIDDSNPAASEPLTSKARSTHRDSTSVLHTVERDERGGKDSSSWRGPSTATGSSYDSQLEPNYGPTISPRPLIPGLAGSMEDTPATVRSVSAVDELKKLHTEILEQANFTLLTHETAVPPLARDPEVAPPLVSPSVIFSSIESEAAPAPATSAPLVPD